MKLALPAGGYVIGVGADLVEVARIQTACERHGERFLARIFTQEERAYCMQMKNPYPHLAARFAAKEAVSKAFTTGIGKGFGWQTFSVAKGEREQPVAVFDAEGQALLRAVGASDALLTLSHTQGMAMAVAVLVR